MRLLFFVCCALLISCSSDKKADYPITPTPFTNVTLTDTFWTNRLEKNHKVTIPTDFKKCEETGRIENFEIAGGLKKGAFVSGLPFDDSDVYKIMEGAAYSLSIYPDAELERYLDALIAKVAAAQEKDGYLMTWRTIDASKPPTDWSGDKNRWSNTKDGHELYNVGHMYEAAVAHYLATGRKTFLKVAQKNADLIAKTFGPGKRPDVPGHEEIEIGLVKLYRVTGEKKYLNLAKHFIAQRGNGEERDLLGIYYQDDIPLLEQDEARGHAVRAGYFYTGAADIAALTGDSDYMKAIERIWQNVVSKKIYITGGIGASRKGEAFGENYELPNAKAYNETCAAIANILWNQRMFLLKGDAKYIDVLERTLYNGMLVGISLQGDEFFYPNPLEFDGENKFNHGSSTRQAWFGCSCCPSNVARFIPSLPGYFYAHNNDSLFINLFASNRAIVQLEKTEVAVTQSTDYPWDGAVKITIDPKKSKKFVVKVRIPGWAKEQPVPSELYSYHSKSDQNVTLILNGEAIEHEVKNGYAVLDRKWQTGDVIQLDLSMPIRFVQAHENVAENFGKVSIERGPIVYCAEAVDNYGKVLNLSLDLSSEFHANFQEHLLNGIVAISGSAQRTDRAGKLQDFRAVPYYAWGHRQNGEMAVWLPVGSR